MGSPVLRFVLLVVSFTAVSFLSHEILKLLLQTSMPVCLVRSNSMVPAYASGDVIFVYNGTNVRLETGNVIVFKVLKKCII